MKAASAEWHRIFRTIGATPASTIAGIAIKLRFVKMDTDTGPTIEADPHDAVCDMGEREGGMRRPA